MPGKKTSLRCVVGGFLVWFICFAVSRPSRVAGCVLAVYGIVLASTKRSG